jgi:oxysterol-binding protein 1
MRFLKRGWGNKNAYKVEGEIYDANEKVVYEITGHWHRSISIKHVETGEEILIWELNPRPEKWDHLYHFSLFTLQLNYIDEELEKKLPVTDSRLRPDQRALENGDLNLASVEKHNVEEFQRKQRKEREEAGIEWVPRYFEREIDEITEEEYFKFNGKYWKDRATGKLKELERVF